jgi:hypothetical protein
MTSGRHPAAVTLTAAQWTDIATTVITVLGGLFTGVLVAGIGFRSNRRIEEVRLGREREERQHERDLLDAERREEREHLDRERRETQAREDAIRREERWADDRRQAYIHYNRSIMDVYRTGLAEIKERTPESGDAFALAVQEVSLLEDELMLVAPLPVREAARAAFRVVGAFYDSIDEVTDPNTAGRELVDASISFLDAAGADLRPE